MEERRHILVVEDDPILGELLVEMLRHSGYDSTLSRTGIEALELLSTTPVDLIISDLHMPGMDGEELWEHLNREQPRLAEAMIFITADREKSVSGRFLERCGRTCLKKPFSLAEFLSLVQKTPRGLPRTGLRR